MKLIQNITLKSLFILISILIGLGFSEAVLRIKHSFIPNYDIEMWKYAKYLKKKDLNPKIGHTHIRNKSANLQTVNLRTNNYGQRDINLSNKILSNYDRSFLILGSSITLGWGVSNKEMFSNVLNNLSKKDNNKWLFVNGGIGNYNTERYINNYFVNWSELEFTDIIIHFFVNDTEIIKENKINFFTKHTHLGVVTWKLINSYSSSFKREKLKDYYKKKYDENYDGFKTAKKELKRLKKHCLNKNLNCYMVIMPDIHQLNPYNLSFINKKISKFSSNNDIPYLDLLPKFKNLDEKDIWNKYQDPHPNSYGHKIIANEIYNYLTE
tara:strand:- start:181 stop:1152 length:972 start_codon:yes stop_codon:yes gene_type:complete